MKAIFSTVRDSGTRTFKYKRKDSIIFWLFIFAVRLLLDFQLE